MIKPRGKVRLFRPDISLSTFIFVTLPTPPSSCVPHGILLDSNYNKFLFPFFLIILSPFYVESLLCQFFVLYKSTLSYS